MDISINISKYRTYIKYVPKDASRETICYTYTDYKKCPLYILKILSGIFSMETLNK